MNYKHKLTNVLDTRQGQSKKHKQLLKKGKQP